MQTALWDYAQKNGIKIEGLEQPKENIGEEEEEEHDHQGRHLNGHEENDIQKLA